MKTAAINMHPKGAKKQKAGLFILYCIYLSIHIYIFTYVNTESTIHFNLRLVWPKNRFLPFADDVALRPMSPLSLHL